MPYVGFLGKRLPLARAFGAQEAKRCPNWDPVSGFALYAIGPSGSAIGSRMIPAMTRPPTLWPVLDIAPATLV